MICKRFREEGVALNWMLSKVRAIICLCVSINLQGEKTRNEDQAVIVIGKEALATHLGWRETHLVFCMQHSYLFLSVLRSGHALFYFYHDLRVTLPLSSVFCVHV